MSSADRTVSDYTINSAPEAEDEPYDMVCPELPSHGKNNYWRESCRIKQQKKDNRLTCYPYCKGGTDEHVSSGKGAQGRSAGQQIRTTTAKEIADKICLLYREGKTVDEIADIVCRSPKLVCLRLSQEGLTNHEKGPSKRSKVFDMWRADPCLTNKHIMDKFSLTRNTVEKYRRDFKRHHIETPALCNQIYEWLDQNLDATTQEVVDRFECHFATAGEYRMRYRRSARCRNMRKVSRGEVV